MMSDKEFCHVISSCVIEHGCGFEIGRDGGFIFKNDYLCKRPGMVSEIKYVPYSELNKDTGERDKLYDSWSFSMAGDGIYGDIFYPSLELAEEEHSKLLSALGFQPTATVRRAPLNEILSGGK